MIFWGCAAFLNFFQMPCRWERHTLFGHNLLLYYLQFQAHFDLL